MNPSMSNEPTAAGSALIEREEDTKRPERITIVASRNHIRFEAR